MAPATVASPRRVAHPLLAARLRLWLGVVLLALPCCAPDADRTAEGAPAARPVAGAAPQSIATGPDSADPRPATVVLVTLDTTRADRLGAYDSSRHLTPRLDALAATGLVFEQARTVQPVTLPAHVSMLTGTYPTAHGVRDNGLFVLGPDSVVVSEVLATRGFATGAFVGSFVLDRRFGLDQGFDVYATPPVRRLGQPLHGADRPADEVVDEALAWLAEQPDARPLFVWVHLFDAHFPYAPPEPFRSRHENPYDGEVAFCDSQVGRLLDGLDALGRDGPRLTLVLADHGEGLGDHGEPVHGVFVYDTTVRVPLIVAGRGVPAGRVAEPVSVADVAPTVLDWLGIPRAEMPAVRVPSLLATARGVPDGDEPAGAARPIPVEALLPWYEHGWHPQRGLVWRGTKWIGSARDELFDLGLDPGETEDLSAARPDLGRRLEEALAALDREHAPHAWVDAGALDDEAREALQSLGYGGRSDTGAALLSSELAPDPKDRLVDLVERDQARWLLWSGRRLLGIDGTLASWSGAPVDERQSARFAEGRRRLSQARDVLDALRARHPGDAEVLSYLGLVLLALDDPQGAQPLFASVASHRAGSPEAHFNLAVAHERDDDPAAAYVHMRQALELEPRAVRATLWLADWHLARDEPGHAAWLLSQLLDEAAVTADESDADVRRVAELLARCRAEATRTGQPLAPPPRVRG